jgi:AbrB family looped-hinge helix DNA binding protein
MTTGRIGKDGTVVIPAELRHRFGLDEGTPIVAEAHSDGVLVKVASAGAPGPADHALLLEETNRAYAALRADPQAWEEELAERRRWETTLADGLDDAPWSDDGGNGAETSESERAAAPRGDLAG